MTKTKKTARKRKARKKNPEILSIINPSPELDEARAAYRRFHGTDPSSTTKLGKNPKKILIVLGRVVEIIYEPRAGERKRIHWVHKFGKRARLATDVTGKELVIVAAPGQKQVDFERGIVS